MAGADRCSICNHEDRAALEYNAQQVLEGTLSWRKAVAPFAVRDVALKNHMERHVLAPELEEAAASLNEEMDALIQEAKDGLLEQFRMSPADVKPLILVAIQNLDGLRNTKPSMETLIRALKTVQEMTGMKSQQRLMVDFAKAMFAPKPEVIQVESTHRPVLEAG